jgi:hypothetical protein
VLATGQIKDSHERLRAVAANPLPLASSGPAASSGALLTLVAVGQPVAAIILWRAYDWALF